MSYDMYPCLKTLEFVKDVLGGSRRIIIDTNIFSLNINNGENDLYHHEDLYIIDASSKNKITLEKIIKLFKFMENQFVSIPIHHMDEYIFFNGFNYNKREKIYHVLLNDREETEPYYTHGVYCSLYALEFVQKILGLKRNIYINSGIYDHVWHDEDYGLDKNEDFHIIFGNTDKKITIDDIYDLFDDMHKQLIIVDEKNTGRSFCFEGIKIDKNKYNHINESNVIQYRICWGS